MHEKTIAIVPAYNEAIGFFGEILLEKVIEALNSSKSEGRIDDYFIIDDGSTDRTYDLCIELGAQVIRHQTPDGKPENLGKARAFYTGLKKATQEGAKILFTTDADMRNLDAEKIGRILMYIQGEPETDMVVSKYYQKHGLTYTRDICSPEYSGLRAIRTNALNAILDPSYPDHEKWIDFFLPVRTTPESIYNTRGTGRGNITNGFCLEVVLNSLVNSSRTFTIPDDLQIGSRGMGEGACSYPEIKFGIDWAKRHLEN